MPTFSKLLQTPKEHCPSTQERIVKSVHQVSIDGRTSDDEIGDSRTSNSRIYLFKGLDTINCTQKSSLGGLGTSYVRDLSTSHVLHCSPIYFNHLFYSSYSNSAVSASEF